MRATRQIDRREALALLGLGAAGVLLGCGGAGDRPAPGSTRARTLVDPDGDGLLGQGPGVTLRTRTDLGTARADRVVATVAQISDPHVRDAQSPGRVAFLDRLGPRFGGAFRPQEMLAVPVLTATVASVNAARPDAVLVTGDLIDSAQGNELTWALTILTGGTVRADSGARGYAGVQAATNPDPLYYRPDVDAPRHPGLLRRAVAPVRSPGLRARWYPVLGNHDLLVQGELAPTPAITAVATGTELVVAPDPELLRLGEQDTLSRAGVDELLRGGLPGETMRVPADPARAHVTAAGLVGRLRDAARRPGAADRLDDAFAVGADLWVIVLDLVRRDAGSGGIVSAATLRHLEAALDAAGERRVLVVGHQPLHRSDGAPAALALLDADPRVIAVVAGHTHRNEIEPHRTPAGGYWRITTASIVDFPQQWRTLRVLAGADGSTIVESWMVDHPGRPGEEHDLAGVARDLAFLDAQGGRPVGAAGPVTARNVRLHLPARTLRPPARRPAPAPAPPSVPPGPGRFGAGDALA